MGVKRNSRREPRSDIVCLEGNGSRPSHRGDGWSESGVMFTLNNVEVHAVCVGADLYNQSVTGDKSKTLNSIRSDSDHVPCVVISYGLEPGACKRMNFENRIHKEVAPTLRAKMGDNQAAVIVLENHPCDSRVTISEDGICQTLNARMGTGGNNVPMVIEYDDCVR